MLTVTKRLLIILIILLFTLIAYIFALHRKIKEFDISTQKQISCQTKPGHTTWLISYADGEVYFANQNALVVSGLNKCIDFFKNYNISLIKPEYVKKHQKIFNQKRGAGYWLWKPYIILDTLNNISEDDIVLYVDSGTKIIKPLDTLLSYLNQYDMIAFKNYHTNKPYIKNDLFKMMEMDTEEARDHLQMRANLIAMRNNKQTRKFVEKWLKWCENEHALTDTPSVNENPGFIEHRHDQAIFSLLLLQSKYINFFAIPFEKAPDYIDPHRRRNIEESLIIPSW